MQSSVNPFVATGNIDPDNFCDRVNESSRLIKSLTNGNNIVLISPRRMGKTELIKFCYQKNEIKHKYHTFLIDILHTSSLKEFTLLLGKEIFDTLQPRGKKALSAFIGALKSINGKFGFDPATGSPVFNIQLGDFDKPEYTLKEIFHYLSIADKPCIIAIDEFQQIAKYPEKNIEALLRSHIQKAANCNFIFAGSQRHMMQEMFLSSSRPFYRSSDMLELKAIERPVYISFVVKQFAAGHKKISPENAGKVYDLFNGHTFYVQKTFNEAFADTPSGKECTLPIIKSAINCIVSYYDGIFREALSNVSEKQKELLYAIAADGEAKQITSATFFKKHSLYSTGSVQAAAKKLLEKDLITYADCTYSVTDKLFALWINKMNGTSLLTDGYLADGVLD